MSDLFEPHLSPHSHRAPPGYLPPEPGYVPEQLKHLFPPHLGYLPLQPSSVPQQRAAAPPRQHYPVTGRSPVAQATPPHRRGSLLVIVLAAMTVAMLLIAGVAVAVGTSQPAPGPTAATTSTAPQVTATVK